MWDWLTLAQLTGRFRWQSSDDYIAFMGLVGTSMIIGGLIITGLGSLEAGVSRRPNQYLWLGIGMVIIGILMVMEAFIASSS